MGDFIEIAVQKIREQVGSKKLFLGLAEVLIQAWQRP